MTADDIAAALDVAEHDLESGDIVLLWTGADRLWASAEYLTTYPGLSGEGTAFLVECGVKTIGIDAWGLDRPMDAMIEEYERTGDSSVLWPAHIYGREREYLQLEKLAGRERRSSPHRCVSSVIRATGRGEAYRGSCVFH